MNINYTKVLLTTYPHIEKLIAQIDELVEKKALAAFSDYSPCLEIAEKILNYTNRKDLLISIKLTTEKIFLKLTEEELELLDYKYFKKKPKEYYIDFDYESRGYFRKQEKLLQKVSAIYDQADFNDQWFKKNCLKIDFFVNMLRRVLGHDQNMRKNKAKKKAVAKKKIKAVVQDMKLSA